MAEQSKPIATDCYARFYPALLVGSLVLTAFPLYHANIDDYGNLYYLAVKDDALAAQGLVLLFAFAAVLAAATVLPRNKVLPIVSAVLAAILAVMVGVVGPNAYNTPPTLTGTAGMAVFLGILTALLNAGHAVHLFIAARRRD